jgi:hypothetical protein
MPTKRTARRAESRTKVTPRAVELFQQMEALPFCTCVWGPRYYDQVECVSCARWWDYQNELYDELKLTPAQYPAINHPPGVPPHDELDGKRTVCRSMSHAAGPGHWPGALELFKELTTLASR